MRDTESKVTRAIVALCVVMSVAIALYGDWTARALITCGWIYATERAASRG